MAKHAKHGRDPQVQTAFDVQKQDMIQSRRRSAEQTGGLNLAQQSRINEHRVKSKRKRIVLIVGLVLLMLAMAALGAGSYKLWNDSHDPNAVPDAPVDQPTNVNNVDDASTSVARIPAPEIASLVGMGREDALAALGAGAAIEKETPIEETTGEGEEKKTEVVGATLTVSLADEQGDTGVRLYLTLDSDDVITQSALSVSMASLNFEYWPFDYAVGTDHVVETLLEEVGLKVEAGSVALPQEDEYHKFSEDGATLVSDQYTFSGTAARSTDESSMAWTLRLSYDYSTYNVSSNYDDVLRQVYITVDAA